MSVEVQVFSPVLNYVISNPTSNTNQVIAQPPAVAGTSYAGTGNGYCVLRIYNAATGPVQVDWGMSSTSATADSTDVVVAAGATELFDMTFPATNVSALLISGTGNVYISVGGGS